MFQEVLIICLEGCYQTHDERLEIVVTLILFLKYEEEFCGPH